MEEQKINRAVEHPVHYCQYDVEVIEMMRRIWGDEQTKTFCKLNAFKYRMRAGHKDDTTQDLEKEKFYLDYISKMEGETTPADKLSAIRDALDNTCSLVAMVNEIREILKG